MPEITTALLEHPRQDAGRHDVRDEPHGREAQGRRRARSCVPCTLLPYEPAFEMGATLAQSLRADGGMFDHGAVKLCHSHCAKFCVLGGGSCS